MQMSMCRVSVITLASFCFEEFGVLQLPTLSPTQGKVLFKKYFKVLENNLTVTG